MSRSHCRSDYFLSRPVQLQKANDEPPKPILFIHSPRWHGGTRWTPTHVLSHFLEHLPTRLQEHYRYLMEWRAKHTEQSP